MEKFSKDLLKELRKARQFPVNTCPYSRHAQMIGENLVREKPYPMLQEEPEHCGGTILATVLSLYQARTEVEKARQIIEDLLGLELGSGERALAYLETFSRHDSPSVK
jgi:hypothetical protein